MKAACLLTDSMYSLAVSANGGLGVGSGALGLGSDAVGESVGGNGTTRARLMGNLWPDLHAVPNPFLGPETRLPDWYPARESLHGLVLRDPDPDPSIEWFSRIRVPM